MSGGLFFANDEEYRDQLREPFPPEQIGKLPKAGTQLDYVGHAAVTDRLNRVAPDWTYTIAPVVVEKDGVPHVLAVPGTMTIGGKTLPECGEVDRPSNYGDELKRGISDLIRRGAMRFGVALDLWSKEDLQSSGEPEQRSGGGRGAVAASRQTPPEPKSSEAAISSDDGAGVVSPLPTSAPPSLEDVIALYGNVPKTAFAAHKLFPKLVNVAADLEKLWPAQLQQLIDARGAE